MAPETERLIELIEAERKRAQKLTSETDKEIKQSDETFAEVSKEFEESRGETEEALKTLRRAGLLVGA